MIAKFTGQERDTETGLDFFQARYHGGAQGRFLSPDPAGNLVAKVADPQTWNMFVYARNNPLSLVDPTGLDVCQWADGTYADDPALGGLTEEDCGNVGGTWIVPTFTDTVDQNNSGQTSFDLGGYLSSDYGDLTNLNSVDNLLIPTTVPGQGSPFKNSSSNNASPWLSGLMNSPWQVGWILPLAPVPGAAGVGPAGGVAWDPENKTLCGSIGAGASVGRNIAAGPVTGRTLDGQQASPDQIDQIFSGSSVNLGYNVPTGPLPVGLGAQASFNGSGVVYGPTIGVAGFSASATYAICAHF